MAPANAGEVDHTIDAGVYFPSPPSPPSPSPSVSASASAIACLHG
ncbi:hypothetical protein ACFV4P_00565 [Kitasatospora sp. NPDC059795]